LKKICLYRRKKSVAKQKATPANPRMAFELFFFFGSSSFGRFGLFNIMRPFFAVRADRYFAFAGFFIAFSHGGFVWLNEFINYTKISLEVSKGLKTENFFLAL
jgi:hypothetical protein